MILYLVPQYRREVQGSVMGLDVTIPLIWVEGQIGAIPIFEKLEDAEKYAINKDKIIQIYV